ncbi:MAG: class I SAM-dependent DNA methyltransferase [Candidatus Thorarchaeota archaeon]
MSSFDEIALAYDNSIDWDARLKREMPFLIGGLSKTSDHHVLDMACGSGRHSVELAAQGMDVVGFDTSSVMIDFATKLAHERGVSVAFRIAEMATFRSVIEERFDEVICLGNSLALLPSIEILESVVEAVYSALNPQGLLIFQVLNFQEILLSGFRFFPLKGGVTRSGEEVIFSRFYEHGEGPLSTLVASSFVRQGKEWVTNISTQTILQTNLEVVKTVLTKAGFEQTEFFSDYNESPFKAETSRNLVVRARRP